MTGGKSESQFWVVCPDTRRDGKAGMRFGDDRQSQWDSQGEGGSVCTCKVRPNINTSLHREAKIVVNSKCVPELNGATIAAKDLNNLPNSSSYCFHCVSHCLTCTSRSPSGT